ncbi:MAG: hypothetical protein ACKVQS_11795 [Fimbriimonadaceae bacterium]
MKKPIIAVISMALLATVALALQATTKLVINGKAVAGAPKTIDKVTYIPVTALKAAGATINTANGTMTINFPQNGGANQLTALEGGMNEWLFNGIWRLRVDSVKSMEGDRPGWLIGVELKNGTTAQNIALDGTGFQSVELVMDDQNILKQPYNVTDFNRPVGQGSSVRTELMYFDDEGNGRKPIKLIVRITPDQFTKDFLKSQKLGYTVPDPSFRINLKTN